MITDETVDKAALAGLNAVRTANGFPSLASIEELPPDDTYRWRQEYRAALEAVAPDIRNAAIKDALNATYQWLSRHEDKSKGPVKCTHKVVDDLFQSIDALYEVTP